MYDYRIEYYERERATSAAHVAFTADTFREHCGEGWEPYMTTGDGDVSLTIFMRRPKDYENVDSRKARSTRLVEAARNILRSKGKSATQSGHVALADALFDVSEALDGALAYVGGNVDEVREANLASAARGEKP